MKVLEIREVLAQLAAIHDRLGSRDCAVSLRDLGNVLQGFDAKTVGAFLKLAGLKDD